MRNDIKTFAAIFHAIIWVALQLYYLPKKSNHLSSVRWKTFVSKVEK